MAVLEYNSAENVMFLCQKTFLTSLYGKLEFAREQCELFDITAPFRMDQEAENIARRMEEGGEENLKQKRKKKRKAVEPYPFPSEVAYLQSKQAALVAARSGHFPGAVTPDEVRANNRGVRERVGFLRGSSLVMVSSQVRQLLSKLSDGDMPERGCNLGQEVGW